MRNIYVDGKLISENADSDNITYLDGSFYYIKTPMAQTKKNRQVFSR